MIKDKQLFYLPSDDMGNLRIAGNFREEKSRREKHHKRH